MSMFVSLNSVSSTPSLLGDIKLEEDFIHSTKLWIFNGEKAGLMAYEVSLIFAKMLVSENTSDKEICLKITDFAPGNKLKKVEIIFKGISQSKQLLIFDRIQVSKQIAERYLSLVGEQSLEKEDFCKPKEGEEGTTLMRLFGNSISTDFSRKI